MSVFDEQAATPAQEETTKTPEAGATPETTSYIEQLVKDRGETWNDPEVIAKGKIEADTHIVSLETQLAELRQDLAKQDYAAKLLETLGNKDPAPAQETPQAASPNNSGTNSDDTSQPISEDDLKTLVEDALTKREKDATVSQNIASVDKSLADKYGAEANNIVKQKAAELGLPLTRMQELAAESPTAFMALIGEAQTTKVDMTSGSIRTEAAGAQTTGQRDWKYYQDLRRKDRSLYYNPKTQQQMAEDRQKLGSRFGMS